MGAQGNRRSPRGFTLVEIMIVVVLIGILASLAIPAIKNAQEGSRNSVVMNGFRVFSGAFATFALENGAYPPDEGPAVLPAGMDGYIDRQQFENERPMGGQWDWEEGVFGITAGVSVDAPAATSAELLKFDQSMDDGNLTTGNVVYTSGRLLYIIEP